MYDLVSLINFLFNNFKKTQEMKVFLNSNNDFIGLDGKFSITNNIVTRELSILKIKDGEAYLIN